MQLERVQTRRPPHVTTRAGGPGASKLRGCTGGGSRPPFPPSLLTAVPTERCLRNSRRRNERHSRSCLSWEEWGKSVDWGPIWGTQSPVSLSGTLARGAGPALRSTDHAWTRPWAWNNGEMDKARGLGKAPPTSHRDLVTQIRDTDK